MKKALQFLLVVSLVFLVGMLLQANSYAATAKKAQKITVTAKKKKLKVGGTTTLSVKGAHGKVTFRSSNTKVATVNSKGKITAKKVGTATITVKAAATKTYKATSVKIKITVTKSGSGSSSSSVTVYITNTGKRYHKGSCRWLAWSKHAISLSKAKKAGYTPCKVCHPPK